MANETLMQKTILSDIEVDGWLYIVDPTDTTESAQGTSKRILKSVFLAEQDQKIVDAITDSTLIGGVTTSSSVPPTGNIHAIGVGEGTYTNWGGMVIPANNFGTLQRVDGIYSVSLTEITGLDLKVNISDIKDNLTSTDTDKPLSANQGKALADAIGGSSTVTTQTLNPNNALGVGDGYSDNIVENQWAITTEEKSYFDVSFVRNSGTTPILFYAHTGSSFTLLDTITPLDNGTIQTFRINEIVPVGSRIAVVGNIGFVNHDGVGLKAWGKTDFTLQIELPTWEAAYKVIFYKESGFVLNDIPTLIANSGFPKYPSLYDKIGVSGTSITYGVGATGGHGGTNKWIYLFKQTLDTVLGRSITIVDGGVSGQESNDMLTNLPALLAENTQIHLLEMAINDAKIVGGGKTFAESESNYRAMISLIKAADIVPVLFTGWPLDMSKNSNDTYFSQSKRTDLNNLARKLSAELNVQLIDLDLVCSQNYDIMGDGLHPNDIGHLWGANVISAGIIQNGTL